MALTPADEAKFAIDYGLNRSVLRPEVQAEYDQLLAERPWPPPMVNPIRPNMSAEWRADEIRRILETRIAALERLGASDPATDAELSILRADRDKLIAAEAQAAEGGGPVRLPTLSATAERHLEQPRGFAQPPPNSMARTPADEAGYDRLAAERPWPPPMVNPVRRPTANPDGAAIAAIICAFVFPLLGIILGHVSQANAKRQGLQPSGLAVGATVLSYLFLILGIIGIILIIHNAQQAAVCNVSNPNWPNC